MRRAALRLYRVRGIILRVSVLCCFSAFALPTLRDSALGDSAITLVLGLLPLLGAVGMLVAWLLSMSARRILPAAGPAVAVHPPVAGRWSGLNSPVDNVPSHGVRAYGQAYAIDLVCEPEAEPASGPGAAPEPEAAPASAPLPQRPVFGTGPAMRAATEYPAFGEPLFAMVSGVVVRCVETQRDHRARSNWLGIAYLLFEGFFREIGGVRYVIGNHITIRDERGVYALVAHVQRGSARVAVGDSVRAGQQIASCGNSGNSSEPHVHAQLMDRQSPVTGQGIPLAFARVRIGDEDEPRAGLPAAGEHLTTAHAHVA